MVAASSKQANEPVTSGVGSSGLTVTSTLVATPAQA